MNMIINKTWKQEQVGRINFVYVFPANINGIGNLFNPLPCN